ncbi:MAG: ABC transporter ATP-binding protein [Planctomycetaceae bacterium]|nr:ABC transporter ATP-binding protein [Planctomycetaceae bacterium]
MSQLVVEQIVREFPTRAQPLRILDGASLSLSAGENVAILGPSGSGKSTLLHIIGTLDRPTSGSVRLGGEDPFRLGEAEQAAFRNRRIGLVFQDHHLLPQCSVLENVLIPTIASGATHPDDVARARTLLDRVGLAARLDHRPAELSGGERQRVAIARALIRQPELLLADEPTGNLDRSTAAEVAALLAELQAAEQTMMVVVTHSVELASHLQRRLELDRGQLRPADQ